MQLKIARCTVLAPLFFFTMFVNYIGDNLSSKTKLRLFSDDTKCTVFYRSRHSEKEARILQFDLTNLFCEPLFNLKECNLMRFPRATSSFSFSYEVGESHAL